MKPHINNFNEPFKIEQKVVELLKNKRFKISFAESMTGGLLAATIINVKGASEIIEESLIVYSNGAKTKYLGVTKETMKEFGVVSEETAKDMADGLYNQTYSHVCVSVTGYAEPAPGKDACKVCVGFRIKGNNRIITKTYLIRTDERNKVRQKTVNQVLYDLALLLK